MSSPSSVSDGDLRNEGLRSVDAGFGNLLAQASYFADLLEEEHLSRLVTIDTNACGVIATVLLAGETVAEDLTDRLPVLDQTTLANCMKHARASQRAAVRLANAAIQQGPTSRRASRRVLCNVGVNGALALKVTAQMQMTPSRTKVPGSSTDCQKASELNLDGEGDGCMMSSSLPHLGRPAMRIRGR